MPLPNIDELYVMLNGSTIYLVVDCNSGYHHITSSPETQKKSAIMTPMGKYEFKKLVLVWCRLMHIKNEVVKGLLFVLGCLDDTLIFSRTLKNILNISKVYLIDCEWQTSN